MREQPNGPDLLAIARDVLKQSILPALPKDKVYEALMIANAMAIASRQYGEQPLAQEWQQLESLLSEDQLAQIADQSTEMTDKVKLATDALVTNIRAGKFDQPGQSGGQLKDFLSWQVLQRLKESNPKALPK